MQPFSNIRVIDLTHVIAGPFCTYQLAVMGAEVIKVEQPDSPDMTRAKSNKFPHGDEGLGYFFTSQNANKQAISVNLKTEEGQKIIRELVANADVFVENYRAGAMKKLGLDYDSLKKIKPDLIYCSMTGFGQEGHLSDRTAYDNVIQAYSGLMSATGSEQTAPTKIGPPILDFGSGIQAAFAISAAIYQRVFSKEGQYIDMSMLDATLMLMSSNVTYFDRNNKLMPLTGNMSPYYAGYSCFETADGLIMLGAYTGKQVKNMWQVFGDPEHGETLSKLQPREMTPHNEEDTKRIAKLVMQKTADQWEVIMNENNVPAARVRNLGEAVNDPQMQSRTVLQTHNDDDNQTRIPVAAFKYAKDGPKLNSMPPVFSQHTHQVLTDLGYNEEQIAHLESSGVIATAQST